MLELEEASGNQLGPIGWSHPLIFPETKDFLLMVT